MRDRLAAETAEERAARLQHMMDRLASETAEERAARLQHMRDRLAAETAEERAARLQHMRDRLDAETEEERAARLQRMSGYQRERLDVETAEERAARLHHDREGHREQQPLLPQMSTMCGLGPGLSDFFFLCEYLARGKLVCLSVGLTRRKFVKAQPATPTDISCCKSSFLCTIGGLGTNGNMCPNAHVPDLFGAHLS